MAGLGGLSSAVGMFGAGVSDLYTAKADRIQAEGEWMAGASYHAAAGISRQNVSITELSTAIKEAQLTRKINMTEGAQVAAEGKANVTGGSAGDLMRERIQQGALAKTLMNTQGQIEENSFKQQAIAYDAMATSAEHASNALDEAAKGAEVGAAFKFLSGGISLIGGFM